MKKLDILLIILCLPVLALPQEILSLPRAVSLGLGNNYSVKLQLNEEQVARNNNTIGNAGFLPSLNWTATQNNSINSTYQRMFSGTEKDLNNARNTSVNTGLQLSWTLFDGFSMFVNRQMLDKMQQLGENNTRVVLENTVSDIAMMYYGIVQMKQMILASQEAVALMQERRKLAEARASIGTGAELAVLQARVDLNSDSSQLLSQFADLANAKADLNNLLARPAATVFDILDSISLLPLPDYNTLLEALKKQNTALVAARMDQELAALDLRSASAARYPRLNFQSSYAYNKLNSQTGFAEYSRSYGPSFGFTASYNLFNGYKTRTAVNNARVQLSSSETALAMTDLNLQTELLKLYTDYTTALALVELEKENLEIARQNLAIAFEKFRIGNISDLEIRDAQKKSTDARYSLIYAQFEAKRTEISLLRLSGMLLSLFQYPGL